MKKTAIFSAAVLLLAACNKGNEVLPPASVRLEPIITRALSLNFNSGDEIGVELKMEDDGSIYAANERMSYDGNCFSGDLKWYADGGRKCRVTAWYPYSEAGFPERFTVAQDQSTGTEASDFMLAVENGVYPSSDAVLAKFRHQFSQINVVIKADFDVAVGSVQLKGVNPSALITRNDDGSISVVADPEAEACNVTAEEITPGKLYSAVLVPQDLSSFGLSVEIKNGSTILSGISNASLRPGYAYTITAQVSADQVSASISGDILAWEDGGNLDAGAYEVPFEEYEGYFVYDGVRYETVSIGGRKWMASPLAYIPSGSSPSADPSSGSIFYPYSSDGSVCTALTDAASIREKGYLYTPEAALCVTLDDSNYSSFEGVQGICPKGWHIPTRAEYFALCGYSNKSTVLGESGAQTDRNALMWDADADYATVARFNEAGFNFVFSGMLYNGAYNKNLISSSNSTVEDYYGNLSVNYLLTSSALGSSTSSGVVKYNMAVLMTTFTLSAYPLGRVTISQMPHNSGAAALRCVKDE